MTTTFTEALTKQTTIMLNLARRLDEKGYAVVVHFLNRDGSHENHPYGYLATSTDRFLSEWADNTSVGVPRATRKRPIIIHVIPTQQEWVSGQIIGYDMTPWRNGKMLTTPFQFRCKIPDHVRYRPINSSLELMSSIKKGRHGGAMGNGVLSAVRVSGYVEYQGDTKTKLEILIRMLEMPEHRKILRGE